MALEKALLWQVEAEVEVVLAVAQEEVHLAVAQVLLQLAF